MQEHELVSRFYGLPITAEMVAVSTARLADPTVGDLVEAHLAINHSCFGAVDKTLAGFFILDQEGGDYTLLDVRGDGRVWWQDHETRELRPIFASLYDWLLFKDDRRPGGSTDDLRAGGSWDGPCAGTTATPSLSERYQWLVRLLAQPVHDCSERTIRDDDDLARSAVWLFRTVWPTDEAAERGLLAELPSLTGDPHLAIYWLLHTSLLAMEPQRARVLAAIEQSPRRVPLVDAFVAAFGSLALDGDIPVVPGFRVRRALVMMYVGGEAPQEEKARRALVALEVAPQVWPLLKFAYVSGGLEDGTLTDAEVADAAARMPATAGMAAEASAPILDRLLESPERWSSIVGEIAHPELVEVVARRILHRADQDGYDPMVCSWAVRMVLAGSGAARAEPAARGFEAVPLQPRRQVLAEVMGEVTHADHPFVGVLLRVLEHAAEPENGDRTEICMVKEMKEEVLMALAPFAHEPSVFDTLMRLAGLPVGATTIDPLWNVLFNPFEEKTYILPRLTGEQAGRAADAMINNRLTHPAIGARNAAGDQLYRFRHVGAEEYMIEALDEYGRRFAGSVREGGKVFDHNQTEDDLLAELMANLYAAVGNMKTPRSRSALVERLFAERREFWLMGNAIGETFSGEVHREALEKLRERRDGLAAGCYAYALASFVKQGPPMVELLRELVGWPVPEEELPRRFFKYALVVGIEAALAAKAYELVRVAHALAASIADQPLEPDEHSRGGRWDNPLEADELAIRLDSVLSGTADVRRGPRPATVPGDAWYMEEEGEWAAGETGLRGRTGPWCFWRPDGTFAEESRWRAGRRHGTHRRYHDDGSLAEVADFTDGLPETVTVYRAETPSQERTVLDPLPDTIRVMVQEFDTEGYLVRRRFRTADGSEVDLDGEPFPPRPENVPEEAEHSSRFGHWTVGRRIPGLELLGVGLQRFWMSDGAVKGVEYHSADGKVLARVSVSGGKGNPLVEAALAGDEEAVEQCLAIGLGFSPGAALHAACEGLTELALRLRDATEAGRPELADPRTESARRGCVPAEGVWVAGLESWVRGGFDPATGVPMGTWHMWRSRPHLDEDQPVEVDFVDGRRARRREYTPWRHDELDREFRYRFDGAQILHRTYEGGVRSSEVETLLDGTTAVRRFHGGGALEVERIESGNELVAEAWFTENGVQLAQVEPAYSSVEGRVVEWWRGLDASGAVIAEGEVRPGIEGGPVGEWRLFDTDGDEHATVTFAMLSTRRRGDLGRLATAIHTWRTMPMPAALTGVNSVRWRGLSTFFGRDAADFPFLLKGLAAPDERAFHQALDEMWDEVLYQHTVSEVAGPAIRFMAALVDSVERDDLRAELLEFILRAATRDGSIGATKQLKTLYDAVPADAVQPHTYFTRHSIEGAYHEIYASLAVGVPTWARLAAGGPEISRGTRQCAVHLLAAAPGEDAGAALRACLVAETGLGVERDRGLVAEILLGLALHPGEATRELLERFLGEEDSLPRFCAALTWVRNAISPPGPALPILIEALSGHPGLDGFGALFLAVGSAPTDAIGAFALLPPELARQCLDEMCAALERAGPLGSVEIARALLGIVFPAGAYSDGTPLTDEQRTVVRAVAGSKATRTFDVNLCEVLLHSGLPCDADELRALCGDTPVRP